MSGSTGLGEEELQLQVAVVVDRRSKPPVGGVIAVVGELDRCSAFTTTWTVLPSQRASSGTVTVFVTPCSVSRR